MARHIHIGILTPVHIGSRNNGRLVLQALLESAPEWSPEKYNYFEPINRKFDAQNLEEALDAWRFSFLWRRAKPSVHGSAWFGGKIHGSIFLRVPQRGFVHDTAVRLFRKLGSAFPIDLAYVHVTHVADYEDRKRYRDHVEPFIVGLTTHRLREGLPDVAWAMLFGRPYIDLFGRERLLATPSARKEELAGGVYLQLTGEVSDVVLRRDLYLIAQRAAREHLDNSAFLHSAPSNELRVPEFTGPLQ